ncbi:MAG: NFACT RNA binding domain-containing protein [Treponema sp.]|jgi:predicted ribosome quality control (RQC) complex YloA/Tae2 family protein|nr:NFACT RNA binding domain-containing protein [Treponema sp.]
MSLNWKEINLILEELDLPGSQIQKAAQSAFDVIGLRVHKKGSPSKEGVTRQLLIALTPGACRMHETFKPFPKSDKPLRFAQFLNSRIVNGWIEEAEQLGTNRIIRLLVKKGEYRYKLYIRLWSNAANFIVTDEDGNVLDAMRRLPKKGEVTGGRYAPEIVEQAEKESREYAIRELPDIEDNVNNTNNSFNAKIDAFYAEKGGALSLEALKEQARRNCEGSIGRLQAALERLRAKEADYASSDKLREYGDIILANIAAIKQGDEWLEADNFYADDAGGKIRIKLDPHARPTVQAELYYEQYTKAKSGLENIRAEITAGQQELYEIEKKLAALLAEDNPLVLAKLLKTGLKAGAAKLHPAASQDKKRPGLSFRRGEWLIIVGRDATENDALLRRHVKGGDLWLHARDFPGSYVFIKQRPGKSFPLEILLDAGNLAIFYSKGRNGAEGDLFYTPVKYLRRAKNGPKGLVIPTQEKNLHIKLDEKRLKELESCRLEK